MREGLMCPSYDWDRYCRDQDAPEMTVLSDRVIKSARKEHKCCMCSQPIKIGTRYERLVFIDEDGKLQCYTAHTMTAACAYQEESNNEQRD